MAHTSKCAASPHPVSRCKCSCDGHWHGAPTGVPFAEQTVQPAIATGWLVDRLASFIAADIDTAFDAEIEIATQIAGDVDALVERVITASDLSPADQAKLRRRLSATHWLCELLVVMLRLRREGRKKIDDQVVAQVQRVVESIVEAIVRECGVWADRHLAQATVKRLLRSLLVLQIKKLIDLLDDPKRVFAVCLVAIVACPDIDKHPGVQEECVDPIVARIRQALLISWLINHCPGSDQALSDQQRLTLDTAQQNTITG